LADDPQHDMGTWLNIARYESRRYGFVAGFFKGIQGRMLDVGCYKGGLRNHLPPYIEYVGADMVVEAFPGAVRLDLNLPKLPFADASFDAVVCIAVLEHVLYPGELLTEMARVVKPQGQALFSLPNDRGLSSIVSAVFYPVPTYQQQVHGHHWRFSIASGRAFLEREFVIEREVPHFGPLYQRYLWFLKWRRLCTEMFWLCRPKTTRSGRSTW